MPEAMPEGDIPQLWMATQKFYDALDAAAVKEDCRRAAVAYQYDIESLRDEGILTRSHAAALIANIKMQQDYAQSKLSGEVASTTEILAMRGKTADEKAELLGDKKTPFQWAKSRGYVTGPQSVGLFDILKFMPESLAERSAEILQGVTEADLSKLLGFKLPWWAWGLLILTGIGVLALTVSYVKRSFTK